MDRIKSLDHTVDLKMACNVDHTKPFFTLDLVTEYYGPLNSQHKSFDVYVVALEPMCYGHFDVTCILPMLVFPLPRARVSIHVGMTS